MRRFCLLFFSLFMTAFLAACSGRLENTEAITAEEFAGVWKANVISSVSADGTVYETAVIELREDGSGTYKGRELVWQLDAQQQTIQFTLTKENTSAALQIQEENDRPVLWFYGDCYYRQQDFIEWESA